MDQKYLHKGNFVLALQERKEFNNPVFVKESAVKPPTPAHIDQLHNEFAITEQLSDVPTVRAVTL